MPSGNGSSLRLQYAVTRNAATESPGTGEYVHHDEPGIYRHVCCGTPLFASDMKFEAACGWPSYFEPRDPANVREKRDTSFGMERTEIICNVCDAHLGHVFPDGPPTTGLRYCIISAALKFEPRYSPRRARVVGTLDWSDECGERTAGLTRRCGT